MKINSKDQISKIKTKSSGAKSEVDVKKNVQPEVLVNAKQKKEVKTKPTGGLSEIRAQVIKLKEELFSLQLDHEQRKVKNTSLLSVKRKEIARLFTTLRIMELTQ